MSDLPRQFGTYSLLKLLAKGGMGEIYLARTGGISQFEKYYAVKKLLKKFAHDTDVCGRFIDEAKLGARLQHPNIVQVYDLGSVSEELFMATEFVDGFDLRRVLRFCHEKRKRIPLDIALFIVREVLSGLAYAHRQVDAEGQSINLIHRDISPQNVLVSFEGEVKIIDFGLAKSTQRSQETQANVLLGNFGYMSPEQARGQRLDVRTDVYSAGIVLFELVTGTKRFVDENPLRLLEMVARPTPIMPSDRATDIPRAIDRIYAGATAPDRDGRYKDAETFRDEVTQALHKLNPRATREHLAQFLNHLFLGGQAPPSVDNDALNKSVAIQVKDLHESSNAFTKSKEDDVQDRALTGFSEGTSETGSHTLMRAARIGDELSHAELTGEEPDGEAARPLAPPSVPSPLEAPPSADELSSPNQPSIMPAPTLAPPLPRPTDPATRPPIAEEAAGEPAAAAVEEPAQEETPLELLESSTTAAPTSVYEAPSFPEPEPEPPPPEELDIDLDIDPPLELELDDPRGLEMVDSGDLVELTPLQAAPTLTVPGPETMLELPELTNVERQGGAVVSTLRAGREDPPEPESDEPTMVVDFESLPGAEVMSGKGGRRGSFGEGPSSESLIIDFDLDAEDELELDHALASESERPPQAAEAPPASEGSPPAPEPPSLDVQPPEPPPAEPAQAEPQQPPPRPAPSKGMSQPVIRPAAQPRGRVVTGAVAKPRRSLTPDPGDPNKRR